MPSDPANRRLLQSAALLLGALALAVTARWAFAAAQPGVSLLLAALALLLCGAVVYWCAPLFVRWARMKGLRFPWSSGLTKQGLFYTGAVSVVALAALTSGNNLIYLILSCMLAAMVIAGFISRLGLSGLELTLALPSHLFAGQPTSALAILRNHKRWMPSFSIWLGVAPASTGRPHIKMEEIYCPMIAGRGEARSPVPATFLRRGRFQQGDFWLRSKFPFSFVERRARLRLTKQVLVYPSVDSSERIDEWIEPVEEMWQAPERGESQDLYRIRPATSDDGARFVDWKATARSTGLMVREFTREDRRSVEVVFDPVVPEGAVPEMLFERGVQLCAALVWRLHHRQADIRFLCGGDTIAAQPNSAAVYEVLRRLAVVERVAVGVRCGDAARTCVRARSGLSLRVCFGRATTPHVTIEPRAVCPVRGAMRVRVFVFFLSVVCAWAQQSTPPASGSPPETPQVEPIKTSIVVWEKLESPTPAYISDVSDEALESRPGVNLDDRLRDVPGFSLFRRSSSLASHPTTQGVSLRGIGSSAASRTLVLFDGLPANDPFGGWVYWSRFNPDAVETVEVSRGASTSAYGDRGMGGTISLRSPTPEGRHFTTAFEGGDAGIADARGGYTDLWGPVGFSGSVRGMRSDGFYIVPEGVRGDVDRKADVDFITGDVRLDFFGDEDHLTLRSNIVAEQRINGTSLRENSSSLGTVGGHYQREGLSITGYHSRGALRSTFSSVAADRDSERLVLLQRVTSNDTGGSLVWTRAQRTWNLMLGADTHRASGISRDTVVFNGFQRTPGGNLWQQGLFVQADADVGRRTQVYGGLRHDFTDRGNDFWSPRGGVAFSEGPRRWRASAFRSFRAPTLNEFFRQFRVGNVTTLHNPDLTPETMIGVDAGMDWRVDGFLGANDVVLSADRRLGWQRDAATGAVDLETAAESGSGEGARRRV